MNLSAFLVMVSMVFYGSFMLWVFSDIQFFLMIASVAGPMMIGFSIRLFKKLQDDRRGP